MRGKQISLWFTAKGSYEVNAFLKYSWWLTSKFSTSSGSHWPQLLRCWQSRQEGGRLCWEHTPLHHLWTQQFFHSSTDYSPGKSLELWCQNSFTNLELDFQQTTQLPLFLFPWLSFLIKRPWPLSISLPSHFSSNPRIFRCSSWIWGETGLTSEGRQDWPAVVGWGDRRKWKSSEANRKWSRNARESW